MIRLIFSTFLFFSFIAESTAQLSVLDSFYNKRLDTAQNIFRSDPQKALKISDEVIKITEANENQLNYSLARALSIKSIIYNDINADSAYYLNKKSLEISRYYDNWEQYYKTLSNLASIYTDEGNYLVADSLFTDIIYHPKTEHQPRDLIVYYIKFSSLKNNMNERNIAMDLLHQAMELSNNEGITKYNLAILNRLANFYSEMGDNRKSLDSHKAMLPYVDTSNYIIYITYNNIANQHIALNELDSARHYLEKVLSGKPKEPSLIYTYQHLATIAKKRGHYEESVKWGQECIDLSNKWNRPTLTCTCRFINAKNLNALKQYSKANKLLEDTKNCMRAKSLNLQIQFDQMYLMNKLLLTDRPDLNDVLNRVLTMKDSIGRTISSSEFRDLETKYQTEKKEAENQLLKKDQALSSAQLAKQKSFLTAAGVAILSLLFFLWNLFRSSKEKQHNLQLLSDKNKAITALNQEINHRSKNHLALATALLSRERTKSSDPHVIETLSDNENRLRTLSLINQKLNLNSTHSDIAILDYLRELSDDLLFSLAKQGEKPTIELDCENLVLDAELSLRLGLITNELITNSLKHARPKDTLELKLSLRKENEKLKLSYADNGVLHEEIVASKESLGLKLIDDIMQQMKAIYEITTKDNFRLDASISVK